MASNYYDCLPESARERLHEKIDGASHGVPKELGRIAKHMDEWEGGVADALELSRAEVSAIKHDYKDKLALQTRAALEIWWDRNGPDATYHNLIQAFIKAEKYNFADTVCEILKEPPAVDTLQTTMEQQQTVVQETTATSPQSTVELQQTVVRGKTVTSDTLQTTMEPQRTVVQETIAVTSPQSTVEPQQTVVQGKSYGKTEMAVLKKNEAKIKQSFAHLVGQVLILLKKVPVEKDVFLVFLPNLFPGILEHVSPLPTISHIFSYISDKQLWSYQNYSPIQSVAEEYVSDHPKTEQLIEQFETDLAGYNATTSITDYIALCKTNRVNDKSESIDEELFQRLSIKLDVPFTEETLEYVSKLWKSLARVCRLPSVTALLCFISEGSLIITWGISYHTAGIIRKEASGTEAKEFFREEQIIEVKINEDTLYYDVKMCLIEVCKDGDIEKALELLKQLPDFDFSQYEYTPLGAASEKGHTPLFQILLENGFGVDQRDKHGYTALMDASREGRTDVVGLLLVNGADVNATDNWGTTALMYANKEGKTDVVDLLLNHGANINETNEYGKTALMYGSEGGRTDVVDLLLNHGANINATDKSGWTALMWASFNGSTDVVELLLNHGADKNATDKWGTTALMYGSKEGRTGVVDLLLNHGANINAIDKLSGKTALMYASKEGKTGVVELLINNSADVNASDNFCKTALMYASKEGQTGVVELLINNSADVNASDNYGITALMLAARYGHVETVKALLDGSADPNVAENEKNWTALFFACEKTDYSWEPEISDESRVEIVHLLIKCGTDVDIRDKSGVSARDVALTYNFQEIGDLLLQHSRAKEQNTVNEETQKRVRTAGDFFRALLDIFLPEQAKKREGRIREGERETEGEVIKATRSKSRIRSFFRIGGRRSNVPNIPTH